MITRRLLPACAIALLLAAPAAAQSDSAVTNAMVSTMDLCLRVLRGQADWQSGLDSLGYRTVSTGGRVLPVGGSVVASTIGSNTIRGVSARICEITASPALSSKTALKAALAARAGGLPPMGEGPISGGGVMDGYADLDRSGLAVLAVTDRPGSGGNPATTSVSVIWK
jgi:hypothetical protein